MLCSVFMYFDLYAAAGAAAVSIAVIVEKKNFLLALTMENANKKAKTKPNSLQCLIHFKWKFKWKPSDTKQSTCCR